jgi:phage baseplate assembly protein W
MAIRRSYRLNPQDLGQPRGIGVNVLFNNSTDVFNTTLTTKDQVKSNLINFLLTNKGERMYDPEFGGDLKKSLFEQADFTSFENVISRLENEIPEYVPNIILQNIEFTPQPDYNLVIITINYTVNQQNDSLVLNVETNNLNTY